MGVESVVKYLAKQRGIDLQDLARQAGWSGGTGLNGCYARNKIPDDKLPRLASCLGKTPDEFRGLLALPEYDWKALETVEGLSERDAQTLLEFMRCAREVLLKR